ncbi:major facilitator superfamily domain-containing protein 12-like [Dysidea avara]|uniref:major facilitator superfamily domain-containing protein 12-like n=1 Tax=Dysidea avara TaxID=196820 RepID=UPI00331C8D5B
MPSEHQLPLWRRWSYGVGHVLNDLCASMWFSYLLVFYHFVIKFPNATAGLLLLIGQTVDALCTPVIGYFCDKTQCFYGRRKIWHLVGTICVAASFSFIFHVCITCEDVSVPYLVLYYACFIAVFQFGWASTQISHLALIPDLTSNKDEQVGLNSIRYGFTVLSNLAVSLAMWQLLDHVPTAAQHAHKGHKSHANMTKINYSDRYIFWYTPLGIIGVGLLFSIIFHLGTKEPKAQYKRREDSDTKNEKPFKWYMWFKNPQFYLVAMIYMCTRLMVNVTQVYIPLYMLEVVNLDRSSVAKATLIIYVSGFIASFTNKYINKYLGRYITYFLGLCILWAAIFWFQFQEEAKYPTKKHVFHNLVPYGAGVLLGISGSILLVTSLSMTADLIDRHVSSGAFVYGAMSFTDKLANGVAIQIIQLCHPCNQKNEVCCSLCHSYYRQVMVFGPAGPSALAFVGLVLLFIYIRRATKERPTSPCQDKQEQCETDPLLESSCSSCNQIKERCLCDFTSDELNINKTISNSFATST